MGVRGNGITVGEEIKGRREALGMTQSQLARRAGTHQSAIASIESGRRSHFRTSSIEKIARALHCTSSIWIRPERSKDEILEARSTKLANLIIAESSGSTALEKQLPDRVVVDSEFQKIKGYLLKHKSLLWRE